MLCTILQFLTDIHIKVKETKLDDTCLLPGLDIKRNAILLDKERLKFPGDLLHEAGHLAVTKKELRPLIGTDKMDPNWPSDGDEISSILWSFAAANHLGIPLNVVFHPNGYKGQSDWIIEQFQSKNYIGLPLLEWMGLCTSHYNIEKKQEPFPIMIKWLR